MNTYQFTCRIQDGRLEGTYNVPFEIDTSGMTLKDALPIIFGGQTLRVKLQTVRSWKSDREMELHELQGVRLHWTEIPAWCSKAGKSAKVSRVDALALLTRAELIETLREKYSEDELSDNQIHRIYNRKHNLDPESRIEVIKRG